MRARTSTSISLALALVAALLVFAAPATHADPAPGATLGTDVVVGTFRVHAQLTNQTLQFKTLGGDAAAAFPATGLSGDVSFDQGSRTATLSLTIENTGDRSLVAPIAVRVTKLASPNTSATNADEGVAIGSWTWLYGGADVGGDGILSPGESTSPRALELVSPTANDFQMELELTAGVPLAPGQGGTIFGPGGTSVTVQPGSVPFEALIDIEPADPGSLVAPTGDLTLAGLVELTFEPTVFNASVAPPTAPLEITIPAPAGTAPGSEFLVAQQVFSDAFDSGDPSQTTLTEQLVAVDTATEAGGEIVTHPHIFAGIFAGGLFGFFFSDDGFATGIVSDSSGPRPGAVVSNSTNPVVAISNFAGRYTIPLGQTFLFGTVTAFDPFRGSSGSQLVFVPNPGDTVTADITLSPLATPAIVRDGIRNSGFERGDLTGWGTTGAAQAIQQLACTGTTIEPTEADWMADISTGAGAVGGVGSALVQEFTVPAGVDTLRFDFNFVSEEFPEFVGTIFNDSFRARITTPNGQSTIASVSVNQSGGFTLIGDCGFPGGDSTSGMTGWRQGSVDLSAFAGTATPITVELLYTANDAGDNIYDTHVLIDNVRFATVWVDVKIITGANADQARVDNEVRAANEILSQAGLNVRTRNTQTVADPGGLLDTDITWTTGPGCTDGRVNGRLTAEETQLMGLNRSATATDVNVYYVRSGTGLAGVGGFAIGPDDFCVDVNILTNSGTLQMDIGMGGNVLAHELGHLLIAPQTAGNALEHSAAAGNFLSTTPALGVVTRAQSANINRAGAPLLVP